MEEKLKKRKTPRYQNFDYDSVGAYFITICTQNKRCILSRIVGTGVLDCPRIQLTRNGEIADKYIKKLNDFYRYLSVEEYVIMPNHIHILLWVKESKNQTDVKQGSSPVTDGQSRTPVTDGQSRTPVTDGQSRTPVPTNIKRANSACSQFVSTFKRFCNKEYGENIWQPRFNDHVIRNRKDYEEHVKYIYENPMRWRLDEEYAEI